MGSPGITGGAQLTPLVTGAVKGARAAGGQERCCIGLEHSRAATAKQPYLLLGLCEMPRKLW